MLFKADRNNSISWTADSLASAGMRSMVGEWVSGIMSMCPGNPSAGYVLSVVNGPLAVVM
jgi:hypothetical protein